MADPARAACRRRLMLVGAAAAALIGPAPAFAQSADGPTVAGTVGEVVVTARRREESLQEVPVAVTAMSGAALESRGFTNIQQMEQVTPGLKFNPGGGGNSGSFNAYIRGVGEGDFIVTSDPAVALYIDGVYVARSFGADLSLNDIERIEVLRGPQGSLFGKNTIGGAVSITTRVPDGTPSFAADARVGSFKSVRVRASGDFPISDTLSMSLSGLYRRADGWQKVPNAADYGDEDAMSARLQLRWRPSDDVDVLFATDGRRQRQNGQPHNTIANLLSAPFAAFSRPFFGPCCELTRDPDKAGGKSPYQDDDADAWNSSLTVSVPFATGTLKSITAYRQVSAFFGRGINSVNPNYYGDFHHEKSKQFSQELQYSNTFFDDRVDFVGGLYYFRERSLDHTNLYVAPGLILQPGFPALLSAIGLPAAAAPNFDINLDFDNRQTTINYAVFGNATIKLTDQVSLDLGGRYTYEKKRFYQKATRVFAQRPLIPQAPEYTLRDSWRAFTPKVTLSYQANPNLLLYGTYSIGFRSGGFNGRPTQFAEIGSYNPERLRSLEAGIKSDLLDGRLRLNLAAFTNRYKNQLQQVNTLAADGITIIARVQNAGRSHMHGAEGEATLVFNKNVSVDGSVAYLKAGYDRYVSNGVDLSYLKLRNSPHWTANIGLNVRGEVADNVEGSFRIDAAYKDRVELDTLNSPFLSAPDYVIANINIGFDFVDKGISLRFTAENITNERVLVGGFDVSRSFGVVEGYYNTPRRFYGTIAYRF